MWHRCSVASRTGEDNWLEQRQEPEKKNLVLLHVISVFQLCLFTLVHYYRSLPFCSGQHCKGGLIYPPWKQSMPPQGWVLWQFSGGAHSLRCSKQTWNTQREFTNMAAHRTARTHEECTTQFCWRCFGSGTAFTDVGNCQRYARSLTPQYLREFKMLLILVSTCTSYSALSTGICNTLFSH